MTEAGQTIKNIGILLSGRGSNFEAIARNVAAGKIPNARIAIVISNKADAGGLETARKLGLAALAIPSKGKDREQHDREVVAALKRHNVDLICLAGYMRLLSPWFVQQFPQKILNIHPSLLPAFPGLEAQEQAFAYGVKVAGCTVHFVDEELDHGAIIVQKAVPVLREDDEHTLAARILEQEHIAYSEAINVVLQGKFEIFGRRLSLSPIETYESRRITTAIRHVLLDVWDPIGVKNVPTAQDEYDDYLGGIHELLISGASDKSIEEHLWRIVVEQIGLDAAQRSDMKETVKALGQIPLNRNSK